jgi:hypothetical protein
MAHPIGVKVMLLAHPIETNFLGGKNEHNNMSHAVVQYFKELKAELTW